MISILKFEWRRMIHSIRFWIAAVLSCLLSAVAAAEQFSYYLQGMDHISVFYRWIGHLNLTFGSRYLYVIIPLLTAFSYSITVTSDRSSGYIYQIVTRVSQKKYFIAKYLVSFAGGGIIFALSILLNFMLLALFMPAEIPDPINMTSFIDQFHFCSILYYSKPYVFVLLWLLTVFLWGGAMSSIGLLAGMLTENTMMAAAVPFLVFIGEGILGTYIMMKNILTMGYYVLELTWNDMLYSGTSGAAPTDYILLTIGAIIGISAIGYWIRVRKYEYL